MTAAPEMQLVVISPDNILTMPTDEFVEFHVQPIQDDHWIRTEDIVRMEDIVDTEGGEKIKQEILQEYTGKLSNPRRDPILEGMLYQEQFMQDYCAADHTLDAHKASTYRSYILSEFRRKNPNRTTTVTMYGEEPVSPENRAADSVCTTAAAPTADQSASSQHLPAAVYPADDNTDTCTETPEENEDRAVPDEEVKEEAAITQDPSIETEEEL